jgi:hypothetical protein
MQRIRSFQAFGTSGLTYTVDVYGIEGPAEQIAYMSLPSGETVKRIRQGLYEVATTSEKLTSTEPDAP